MSGAAPISFVFQVAGDQAAKGKIASVASSFRNFGQQAETTSQQTQKVTRDFKGAALGMSTAASSAIALTFQYDNLQKSTLRVSQAKKNLTTAEARLSEAKQALEKITIKGISTGADYEQAILRLEAAQQNHTIATEKLSIATGDLSQDQIGFALQVVPTVISAAASASTALTGLGVSFGVSGAGALAGSGGLKAFAMAVKTTMIAMGPIGWTLLGIGTVLTLIATNAFGVRDAINAMGKAIGDAIPFLKPILEFFGTVSTALFGETDAMKAASAPAPVAEGPVPDWAQAGGDFGNSVTSSISHASSGGGGNNISVKVYVDGKEIASRIKLSTTKKG